LQASTRLGTSRGALVVFGVALLCRLLFVSLTTITPISGGSMSDYTATIEWQRAGAKFTDNRYSRGHSWKFDGGVEVPGSSSPHSVRLPFSVAEAVAPEEAFVASLASCHMLWFLSIAAKHGYGVERYRDEAVGVMARNAEGKLAMTLVTLRPVVTFFGEKRPSATEHQALHHEAHEECYIASSVKTEVRCEPVALTT
jgi:organic hydroperoxide reductase OsmC/OhrA